MRQFATRALATALLLAPFTAGADPAKFTVDPAHSSITFTIRHLVSLTSGRFKKFEGAVNYDEKNPTKSDVSFVVQADSIDTDSAKRDEHLRGADFFDVAKYPTLEFQSKKVVTRGKNLEVFGELKMHGVTKAISVSVEPLGTTANPFGGTVTGFKTEFVVNRKDFGIVYNKTLDSGSSMLGDEVTVRMLIEAGKK